MTVSSAVHSQYNPAAICNKFLIVSGEWTALLTVMGSGSEVLDMAQLMHCAIDVWVFCTKLRVKSDVSKFLGTLEFSTQN